MLEIHHLKKRKNLDPPCSNEKEHKARILRLCGKSLGINAFGFALFPLSDDSDFWRL